MFPAYFLQGCHRGQIEWTCSFVPNNQDPYYISVRSRLECNYSLWMCFRNCKMLWIAQIISNDPFNDNNYTMNFPCLPRCMDIYNLIVNTNASWYLTHYNQTGAVLGNSVLSISTCWDFAGWHCYSSTVVRKVMKTVYWISYMPLSIALTRNKTSSSMWHVDSLLNRNYCPKENLDAIKPWSKMPLWRRKVLGEWTKFYLMSSFSAY